MEKNLTCFKCWKDDAALTYEGNRRYKVACSCGCEYDFNHCSMTDALQYHLKMLELDAEIDTSNRLRSQLVKLGELFEKKNESMYKVIDANKGLMEHIKQLESERDAAVEALGKHGYCLDCTHETMGDCIIPEYPLVYGHCDKWKWHGTEGR